MATGHCIDKDWCESNEECDNGQACDAGQCVDPVPHDVCDAALLLEPGVPLPSSTRQATDLSGGTCSERPSPEVVFRFEIDEPSGVRVLVDGAEGRFDATIYLRTTCTDDPALVEEVACSDVRFSLVEQLEVEQVQAGTYFVYVESFGPNDKGDFTITLDVQPGEICVGDVAEPNDAADRPADLFQAQDRPLHLCPGDVDWFAVGLHAGDEVIAAVTTTPEGAGVDGLELSLARAGGDPLPGEVMHDGDTLQLRVGDIPAGGQHVLRVGHADAEQRVDYVLAVEVFTAHGTCDCTNPTTLRAGVPLLGNTSDCGNETSGTCRSVLRHDAPEVPYKFHIEDTSHVTISVDARWDYMVYLRQSCRADDISAEPGCEAPGEIDIPALEAGTYYVYVDGRSEASGAFELSLEVGPPDFPPENDTCDDAEEILPGQVKQGTTAYADDEYSSFGAECTSPFGHNAPEVVYRFTLGQPDTVRLLLTPVDFEAALYVRPEPCEQEDGQLLCGAPPFPGGPVAIESPLEPGTYYVFVDGFRSGHGDYELALDILLPEDE